MTYRPPNGDVKKFEKHLIKIPPTNDILKMEVIMAGDFNINLLDFKQNKNIQNSLNIMFDHSMMLFINKPTRVTKNTASAIDQVTSVTTTKFKTGIIKLDILDHFPIFFVTDDNIHIKETKERFIFRRDLSYFSVENSPLAGTVSQTLLIQIKHMKNLMKFLAHFMKSIFQKRKLN